ncbi:MAG: hypothetical protein IJQ99_09765 [Synergistaceae bacterium]|nr:hypothetical protein [Synergistaceae bacterium]
MSWRKCKLCQAFYDDKAYYARKGLCFKCMSKLEEIYNRVHEYLRTHEITSFNNEAIAREVNAAPKDIEDLFNLGFLERDIKTYSSIKTERQELAEKFRREINIMTRQKKVTTYGGFLYGR